jgi:hypothetical protein
VQQAAPLERSWIKRALSHRKPCFMQTMKMQWRVMEDANAKRAFLNDVNQTIGDLPQYFTQPENLRNESAVRRIDRACLRKG